MGPLFPEEAVITATYLQMIHNNSLSVNEVSGDQIYSSAKAADAFTSQTL
jgi:hypothetical protein